MTLYLHNFYTDQTLDIARAPKITFPEHYEYVYERNPVIEASGFDPLFEDLERDYRQFQIRLLNGDWDNEDDLLFDETVDGDTFSLSDVDDELPTDTTLALRVRDVVKDGIYGYKYSPWYEVYFKTVPFETGAPQTPEGEIIGTDEHLEGPSYHAKGEHIESEFEIRRKSDEQLVHASSKDEGDLEILTLPADDLEPGTNYQWRVRYKSSDQGWLEWTEWTTFTSAHVEEPEASSPRGNNFISLGQTLYGSSPSVSSGDMNHDKTQWEIFVRGSSEPLWTETNVARSITPPFEEFNESLEFEWRVRYHDSVWGWSQWSERAQFKIPLVKQPEAISPADGEEDVRGPYVTLEASDFEVDGDDGRLEIIEWRVIDKDTGEEVFFKREDY